MKRIFLTMGLLFATAGLYAVEPGEPDAFFNSAGTNPAFENLTTELPANLPAGAVKAILYTAGGYFVASDDGDGTSSLTKIDRHNLQDLVFGVQTLQDAQNPVGMMVAQDGNIMVFGGSGDSGSLAGWVYEFDATTGKESIYWMHPLALFDDISSMAQQSTGRMLVAGAKDGIACIVALNPVTGAVDETWGNHGGQQRVCISENVSVFCYSVNSFDSMVVDAQDNIYFSGITTGSTPLGIVVKLNANGAMLANTLPFAPANTAPGSNKLAFALDGSIMAACATTDGNVHVQNFSADLSTLVASVSLAIPNIVSPNVTGFVMNTEGSLFVIGNDAAGTSLPFVAKIESDLSALDSKFNKNETPGYQTYYGDDVIVNVTAPAQWQAAIIKADGPMLIAGAQTISDNQTPFLQQLHGNLGVGQYLPTVPAGTPGTINTNFGVNGKVNLTGLQGLPANAWPTVVLPQQPDGMQYIAFNVPGNYSFIARFTNQNVLDPNYGTAGISQSTNFGINSLMMDGKGRLVASGVFGTGQESWACRYVAGDSGGLDTTFNHGSGVVTPGATFTRILEQTLGRYVIAGSGPDGNLALWAYTPYGAVDTTFNSNAPAQGSFVLPIQTAVYGMIADQWDRLYIAVRSEWDIINVVRLAASGQIDTTFGTGGMADIISNADDASQIRLAFDAVGNVVVAAHVQELNTISGIITPAIKVAALDTTGAIAYAQISIAIPNLPIFAGLVTTSDDYVLLSGSQSGSNTMWVARVIPVAGQYQLDTNFAPAPASMPGLMEFSFDSAGTVTSRNLTSIAMYGDGTISLVGTETDTATSPHITAFLSNAYDDPYVTQEIFCQNSKPMGSNDRTFGVLDPQQNGFALPNTTQQARALQFQDDQTLLIAAHGPVVLNGGSVMSVYAFNVDGLLDLNFNPAGTPGSAVVLGTFEDQYVSDMIRFETQDGTQKALFVGYATNAALQCSNLLHVQYDFTEVNGSVTPMRDSYFGGCNGDDLGVAVGNNSAQGFATSRQSNGAIVTVGLDVRNSLGLLQRYSQAGKLDPSFGLGGTFAGDLGTTGIYAVMIDSVDRVVVAYNDGSGNLVLARILADGSDFDTTFGTGGKFVVDYTEEAAPLTSNDSFGIVFDELQNIYVVANVLNGTAIAVDKLDPNAAGITASSTLNGTNFGGFLDGFILGKVLRNQAGDLVILGSDADSILITQIVQDHNGFLIQDPGFNAAETPGYTRYNIYNVRSPRQYIITDAAIHPDGRYVWAGYTPNVG